MALYEYECLNKNGDIVTGRVEAEQEAAAVVRLRKMGLNVINVKEINTSSIWSMNLTQKKVSVSELALFSRQLSSMLAAGIPVTRALFTLSKQASNPTLKDALGSIARNVEGGMNLTEAMGAYPKVFSPLYISMIHAGELGGTMEETLGRLSQQLQKDKMLRDNVKSATMYPRAVGIFAIVLLLMMLLFLVPVFKTFIPEGTQLPLPTKLIFSLSASLRSYWYLWFLFIGFVITGLVLILQSAVGKKAWDRVKFRIPAFGSLIHKSVIARFTRTLATLLEGGIPVVQALESSGPTAGSSIVAEAVMNAGQKIQEGKNIAGPLEESGVFPPMVIQMISVGEETGMLPSLLDRIADFYEDEVAIMTKGLTAMIEPLMLIIVGVVIGGMLISLYLPIFTAITSSAGG